MKIYIWQTRWHWWVIGQGKGRLAGTRYSAIEKSVLARHDGVERWNGDRYGNAFTDGEKAIACACEVFGCAVDAVEVRPFKRRVVERLPHCRIDAKAQRGEAFAHETNDCTVIALANVTGKPYAACHERFKTIAKREDRQGAYEFRLLGVRPPTSYQAGGVEFVLGHSFTRLETTHRSNAGPAKHGYRMSLKEFIESNPVGTFYVCASTHAFAVYDGMTFDLSPHTGRERVTNAYRVERSNRLEDFRLAVPSSV